MSPTFPYYRLIGVLPYFHPISGVTQKVLLVFSVTQFKIDQNKNQNRSIDKVQNLGNERR